MLKKKVLRKIFVTTLTAFILLVMYSIPNLNHDEKTIKTNLEVEYVTGIGTNNIYLLDDNNYLVKNKVLLDSTDKIKQIKQLISYLTKSDTNNFPSGLNAIIPENTKLLNVFYDEGYVTVNFNRKILNIDPNLKERMIESIVYSIMDLGDVKGIIFEVEEEIPEEFGKVLDKSIGINKTYEITSRNDINKVVVYYLEHINNDLYYVPVTRYLNDSSDKVKIIVNELTTSYIYENNLMSFLNSNAKLIDYKEQNDIMTINFNNAIFSDKNKILEEVSYSLAYSIFDNYNVKEVMIEVNGKNIKTVKPKDLP